MTTVREVTHFKERLNCRRRIDFEAITNKDDPLTTVTRCSTFGEATQGIIGVGEAVQQDAEGYMGVVGTLFTSQRSPGLKPERNSLQEVNSLQHLVKITLKTRRAVHLGHTSGTTASLSRCDGMFHGNVMSTFTYRQMSVLMTTDDEFRRV